MNTQDFAPTTSINRGAGIEGVITNQEQIFSLARKCIVIMRQDGVAPTLQQTFADLCLAVSEQSKMTAALARGCAAAQPVVAPEIKLSESPSMSNLDAISDRLVLAA